LALVCRYCPLWIRHYVAANFSGYPARLQHVLKLLGAPYASITNLFGFLPVALSSIVIIAAIMHLHLSTRRGYLGAALVMIGISTGYLVAVFFPCDLGCPIEGSPRQAIHNLAGLIQYPLGAVGLFLMGREILRNSRVFGWLLILSGLGMGLGFVMMLVPDQADMRGAWQRLGDYSAFIAIGLTALCLSTDREVLSEFDMRP
jgi:hypothetical protein